jgi:integrase
MTGTFLAAEAPPDRWPAPAALDPKIALLRSEAEAAPDKLFVLAHAARLRALQAMAPNTQRGYDSDWRGFVSFCRQAGFNALPASPPALEAFIEYSLPYSAEVPYQYLLPEAPRRNCKASTVARAIAAIGAIHRWLRYPDPTAHDDVVHTFKINTRGRAAKQPKAPLPYSAIERALPTYAEDGAGVEALPELRTKALVTLGFSTMLRRSELVALEVADFQPSTEADDGLVRVKRSKTDQAGHGAERYVSAEARQHLESWLAAAGITEGPIFARLNRNGKPLPKPLHPNRVSLEYKGVARRAGFAEHEITRIAGHSTRIGAAQALSGAGFATGLIAKDGGWGSEKMVITYNRTQAVRDGAMAQWFLARSKSAPPRVPSR